MKHWYWSNYDSGNAFHGPHETREAALEEALLESGATQAIYIGQSHTVYVEIDADTAIDHWVNYEGDLLYEDALDSWCLNVPSEAKAALTQELSDCFRKHLETWGEDFSWEVISDPECVRQPTPEGESA